MNKRILIQAAGAVAFVVAGFIARMNVIETVEKLDEKYLSKDSEPDTDPT